MAEDFDRYQQLADLLELTADHPEQDALVREVLAGSVEWSPHYWRFREYQEEVGERRPARAALTLYRSAELEGELLAADPEDRPRTIDAAPRFHVPSLAVRLLHTEERDYRFASPIDTLHTAAAAHRVAERDADLPLSLDAYADLDELSLFRFRRAIADLADTSLLARTVARVMNSHRVCNSIRTAASYLPLVRELVSREPVGVVRAECELFSGKVLTELEDWTGALKALKAAAAAYRAIGCGHRAASAKGELALAHRECGADPATYLAIVEEALAAIDRKRDERLFQLTSLVFPLFLVDDGQPGEALKYWRSMPVLDEKPLEIRRQALGAVIDLGAGVSTGELRAVLKRTVDFFSRRGLHYDQALYQLYLAKAQILQGQSSAAGATIIHALGIFDRLQVKRYVAVALHELRLAVECKTGELMQILECAISRASGRR